MSILCQSPFSSGRLTLEQVKPLPAAYGASLDPDTYVVFWDDGVQKHRADTMSSLATIMAEHPGTRTPSQPDPAQLARIFASLVGVGRVVEDPDLYRPVFRHGVAAKLSRPTLEGQELSFVATRQDASIVSDDMFCLAVVDLRTLQFTVEPIEHVSG